MLPPTPTQFYLVWIRFRRKISFVMSFTISEWLKKYYFIVNIKSLKLYLRTNGTLKHKPHFFRYVDRLLMKNIGNLNFKETLIFIHTI